MGLDMYLNRKIYIGANYDWNGVEGDLKIKKKGKELPLELKDVKSIVEEVAYWRKANQIHKWFVDNIQEGNDNCGTYYVSKEDLEKLLNICKQIKEKCPLTKGMVRNGQKIINNKWQDIIEDGEVMTNTEVAEELLPSQSGFFFGSTDYDEYYYNDICYTIDVIEKAFKEDKELEKQGYWSSYEYSSSW